MNFLDFFIRNRRIRSSLLIIFMTFIILPALAVGIFSYVQSRSVLERSIFNTLEYLIEAQENALTDWSIDRKNFLEGLADTQPIKALDLTIAQKLLEEGLGMDKNFRSLALVGLDGKVKVEPYKSEAHGHPYVGDREYFKRAIKGQTYVSDVLISRNTNEPVLVIATPIWQKDTVVGVLFGAVKVEVITGLIQVNSPGDYGESYLVNKQGLMLNQSKFLPMVTSFKLKAFKQPLNQIYDTKNGRGIYTNYRNKKVFGIYRNLPLAGLGLVVEKEYHNALLEYGLQTYLSVAGILGIIVVIFIAFGVYYSRRLSKPLELLAAEVNNMADGSYRSILTIQANKEVQEVSNAVNHMSSKILEKTNELNNLIEQLEQYTDYLNNENNQLARISKTDELTGLYNRRYLNQELEGMIHLSSSLKKSMALLMLDLDRFKRVNDTYGHPTGDVVLKEFAQLLKRCSRGQDLVGRFGGEEFIVVVPFVRGNQAKEIGERIRRDVKNFVFDNGGHNLYITVSIGIATLTPSPELPVKEVIEKLLKTADDCLYHAKETGRDKVVCVDLDEIKL